MIYWPTVDTLVAAIKGGLSMMYHRIHHDQKIRSSDSTLNWRSIRVYTDVQKKPLGCSDSSHPYRSHGKIPIGYPYDKK